MLGYAASDQWSVSVDDGRAIDPAASAWAPPNTATRCIEAEPLTFIGMASISPRSTPGWCTLHLPSGEADVDKEAMIDGAAVQASPACSACDQSIRRIGTGSPSLLVIDRASLMSCSHISRISAVHPSSSGCIDCLRIGERGEQLRMCMECGHVGCGDSSKNQHAVKHFRATGHPVARSMEPGEQWGWCYIDQLWFEKLAFS